MNKNCTLRGISAPQLTPFHKDGSVNYEEYTRLTQTITQAGVHGIFVCGTSGEFINLTLDERKKLLSAALKGAGANDCVMFNTTAMNVADMKDLFQWARSEGAVAASITAPYYHKYDAAAMVSYFETASRLAGDMPVYLYNMPAMTHNPITADIVRRICRSCPNIVGIKDSSMDFMVFQEYQCLDLPDGFELITGNDAQVLPVFQAGGDGGIIAMASVYPALCQRLWAECEAGELERARCIQKKILRLRDLARGIMPIMAHKKMLEMQGFYMGPARFPFRELTEAECWKIETNVKKILEERDL